MELFMRVCFDLDGTLRDVEHRRYLTSGPSKNWQEFFRQSEFDPPIYQAIEVLYRHWRADDEIEIWSGCSDEVWDITCAWLDEHITELTEYAYDGSIYYAKGSSLLKRMRPKTDYRPDYELKEMWLKESIANGWKPDLIYDDRQSVVDMWRRNGIVCFQVAPGDFDKKPAKVKRVRVPRLTLMVGPSGAGKSSIIERNDYSKDSIVSSDRVREQLFGRDSETFKINESAYTPEGFAATFAAVHAIVKARIEAGLDVVVDATNLKRADRVSYLKTCGLDESNIGVDVDVAYILVDRPLQEKLKSWFDNPVGHTDHKIIEKHHETFQSSKRDALNGDGFSKIVVMNKIRSEVNA
jgi:predicted kinase